MDFNSLTIMYKYVYFFVCLNSAMDKFKGLDKRAQEGTQDTAVESTHQNAITQISQFSGTRDNVTAFSTTGVDGKLVIWNCKSIESQIAGLTF